MVFLFRFVGARRLAFAFLLAGAMGLSATPVAFAQDVEAEIEATARRLDAARAAALQLIAPQSFARAAEQLAEARGRHARGAPVQAVLEALSASRAALNQAESFGTAGRDLFAAPLAARQAALESGAPERAADLWAVAEQALAEAGRRWERGEREAAAAGASAALTRYREAEVEALRVDVLGPAREMRDWAVAARADRFAPVTFGEAEALYGEANRLLAEDRNRLGDVRRLGLAAAAAYRRGGRIAVLADSLRRGTVTLETVIRRQEEKVERIGRQLRFEPDLSAGLEPVVAEALAAIRGLQTDRENLQRQLSRRDAELAAAVARIDSLESRLAGIERREAELAAELRERERRERRLREVRAIFTPEEGEVLVRGDTLTIRLFGLTFETGRAEIRPEHFPLLTKLQQVLREFPGAGLTVEGHTDARGNDDFNRALSQRRAIAVREYLLTNMPISASRITAVGYGEERPIASNETPEGQRRNRRIEIQVDLSGG